MKILANYLMIPIIAGTALFSGCSKSSQEDIKPVVEPNSFSFSQDSKRIVEQYSDMNNDGKIKLGVVSDIQGSVDNAISSARKLASESIDAVVIAGDNYENEKIRNRPERPFSTNNVLEMVESITPYAKLGVPVFVIAGNHETTNVYSKAIEKLSAEYSNVFDINERFVDIQGMNIVGMGGYHQKYVQVSDNYVMQLIPDGGFQLKPSDYNRALVSIENLHSQGEPIVFVTHGPPKSVTNIDRIRSGAHVGDDNIAKVLNYSGIDNVIHVAGHLTESGGNHDTSYSSGVSINVAGITDFNNSRGSNTGMITIENGRSSYKELR